MSDAFNKTRLYAENEHLRNEVERLKGIIRINHNYTVNLVNQEELIGHLEQQAKDRKLKIFALEQGVSMIQNFSEALIRELLVYNKDNVDLFEEKYIGELREQAKALKEQGE